MHTLRFAFSLGLLGAVACGGSSEDDPFTSSNAGGSSGSSQAGSSQAGSSQAGSSQAGSSQAGSSQAGSSQAGSSQAGSSQAGEGGSTAAGAGGSTAAGAGGDAGSTSAGKGGSTTAGQGGTGPAGQGGTGPAGQGGKAGGGGGPLPTTLTTLAEGLPISSRIVERGPDLFVTARGSLASGTSQGGVYRVAKSGGAKAIASNLKSPTAITVGGDGVYFHTTGDGVLARIGFDGTNYMPLGTISQPASPVSDMVFVGPTLHWFVATGAVATPQKTVATLPQGGGRMVTDGTRLFLPAGGQGMGQLYVLDPGSGQSTPLAGPFNNAIGVAVAGTTAFVADPPSGTIFAAGTDGSGGQAIATGEAAPWALATDGVHLYWVNHGGSDFTMCTPGAIVRSNLDGSEKIKLGDVPCPVSLVLDATHVFVVSTGDTNSAQGRVYRVGK